MIEVDNIMQEFGYFDSLKLSNIMPVIGMLFLKMRENNIMPQNIMPNLRYLS